ncbi:hypothetical protein HD806DRAFT_10306 [Xylariaceae sp. AK1471]|nr:hypothetical protein HD806DRAFT_10306 [Xylariaceae sp. AK1471]
MLAIVTILMVRATTSWAVAAVLALSLCHLQGTLALPTTPPANAAVEIAKKSYQLSVVLTIMASIMLLIATIDFLFRMTDRVAACRQQVDKSLPRNPVNDVEGAHAHAMLGQSLSPGDVHNIAQRQLVPITGPAVKQLATANPSPMPSERPSRSQGSAVARNESSRINPHETKKRSDGEGDKCPAKVEGG